MKTTKLERLDACYPAINWVKAQKSAEEAWMNCNRGDWMLWLAQKLNIDDKKLTLAKAKCVEQVRHLIKDQRSIDALDACYKYVNGEITKEEFTDFTADAAYAASAAAYAAAAASAYAAAADAAYAASAYAASAAAAAAASAYAASAAASSAAAAAASAYAASAAASSAAAANIKRESLKKSADICREILTEEILEKYKNF